MSDNIFDRLMDLLQSEGPINWKLAREMATSIAGPAVPIDPALTADYEQLLRAAQLHVAAASGLDLGADLPAVHVVDRRGWAAGNLEAFRYLLDPIAAQLTEAPESGPLDALLKPLGPAILGMQMGSMVGFISQRVLGQFDVGLPAATDAVIYFVVPNIEAFATDHGLEPHQTRLWVALHEVTHQAEFAVPWVRGHFMTLIERYLGGLEFDPTAVAERLESLQNPEQLEEMFRQPAALVGLIAGPEQQEVLADIQAFMALIEGYGDYLMDRAAPGLIPDTARLREALTRRRAEPSQGERILQQLLGLELKRQQYRLGAEFCAEIVDRWGEAALARVWSDAGNLPTLRELEDPLAWAARVLVEDIGRE